MCTLALATLQAFLGPIYRTLQDEENSFVGGTKAYETFIVASAVYVWFRLLHSPAVMRSCSYCSLVVVFFFVGFFFLYLGEYAELERGMEMFHVGAPFMLSSIALVSLSLVDNIFLFTSCTGPSSIRRSSRCCHSQHSGVLN